MCAVCEREGVGGVCRERTWSSIALRSDDITVRSGQITMFFFSKFPTFQRVTVTGAPNDAEHSWWTLSRPVFLWCRRWGWVPLLLSDFIYRLITWSLLYLAYVLLLLFSFFLCYFSFFIYLQRHKSLEQRLLCGVWCFGFFFLVCFNQVWRRLNKLNKMIWKHLETWRKWVACASLCVICSSRIRVCMRVSSHTQFLSNCFIATFTDSISHGNKLTS